MPAPDIITVAQLWRLFGTPEAPLVPDVRVADDVAADPRTLPASRQRDHRTAGTWALLSAVVAWFALFRFKFGVVKTLGVRSAASGCSCAASNRSSQ